MAQLWGGRFTKETDQLVYNFNASISFDQKFYLKLNLAVGGSWGGTPAADFTEDTYEIDWVRVYQ